ncbi:MAG TPA: hypothetical protein VKN35_02375, partial [Xanthomonadales bacterium]|nr:hypothetical protein [Xanthomonadales bacterium]
MNELRMTIAPVVIAALLASATVAAQGVKETARPTESRGEGLKLVIGPDAFGYMGYDSAEAQCQHTFYDISSTGALIVSGDDESGLINLPGPAFDFYGVGYNQLYATTNGVISSTGDAAFDWSNTCPLPSTPNIGTGARMYPLHDDLISDVYYEYFAECPRASGWGGAEGCHIIQWANVTHFGWDDDFDFQAILYETSFGIVFQHSPANPEAGGQSTTGIQNAAATDGLTFACDTLDSVEENTSQCVFHPDFPFGSGLDDARFNVTKNFTDDNPGEVEVTLDCFTGLPITQSQTISEAQDVNFIVESFEPGTLDCNITESDVPGYSASYSGGNVLSADACEFTDLGTGQYYCEVTNSPDPVGVSVFKDWIIEGAGGDSIDPYYRLVLWCNGEISGGIFDVETGYWSEVLYDGLYLGTADVEFNADVVPDWDGGTDCWVTETVYDSGVEVDNACGDSRNPGLLLELTGGDSCTITNTVFFEGIPTLSQFGLAIMALLMLGVGF